jgi:CBS domain-containing protein
LKRITSSFKAKDIMTRKVFSVRKETPLKEVADILALKGVAGVPVLENDGKVAGIISEKDFLFRMGSKSAKSFMSIVTECLKGKGCVAVSVRAQKAGDIMSSPAVVVSPETTVMEIADIFAGKDINRVPVVDEKGMLVGIVSRKDIIKTLRLREASSLASGPG